MRFHFLNLFSGVMGMNTQESGSAWEAAQNKKKILGIVAEYNPFHHGHKYQIEQAKKQSEADYVIIAMSGHFVQRGEPAIYDSHLRAEMALRCGADAVFEIPCAFSTASAEDFAGYALRLLEGLGADCISFGVENAEEEELRILAKLLLKESEQFQAMLKKLLARGMSFPLAREKALSLELRRREYSEDFIMRSEELLRSPNNILALEYIKSLIRMRSLMKPVLIRREGSAYHCGELEKDRFSSATAIRRLIREERDLQKLRYALPDPVLELIKEARPLFADDFSFHLYRKIRECSYAQDSLEEFWDISKELGDRISRRILLSSSYAKLVEEMKTRQYTYTRVSRALSHILLNIKKKEMGKFKAEDYAPYAALLGFRSTELLRLIKKRSALPLLSKLSAASKLLPPSSYALFTKESFAAELYNSVYFEKYEAFLPERFRRRIVRMF